tara:strand:+ start:21963 stop:22559 length:597 start_codon:yes stop_codon:yes gene_type:complete
MVGFVITSPIHYTEMGIRALDGRNCDDPEFLGEYTAGARIVIGLAYTGAFVDYLLGPAITGVGLAEGNGWVAFAGLLVLIEVASEEPFKTARGVRETAEYWSSVDYCVDGSREEGSDVVIEYRVDGRNFFDRDENSNAICNSRLLAEAKDLYKEQYAPENFRAASTSKCSYKHEKSQCICVIHPEERLDVPSASRSGL